MGDWGERQKWDGRPDCIAAEREWTLLAFIFWCSIQWEREQYDGEYPVQLVPPVSTLAGIGKVVAFSSDPSLIFAFIYPLLAASSPFL